MNTLFKSANHFNPARAAEAVMRLVRIHRRKSAAVLLLASVFVLYIGMVRFVDYTLPMLQGDFQSAAQPKSQVDGQPDDDTLGPLQDRPTIEDLVTERFVEGSNKFFDWSCGSRNLAMFNEGWKRYQDYDFEGARSYFDKAFVALGDANGAIRDGDRRFASDLQLLIGNCYANRDKIDQAVSAYEMSLTLNPNNIISTYNLERLQDAKKAGGGGKGKGGAGKRI